MSTTDDLWPFGLPDEYRYLKQFFPKAFKEPYYTKDHEHWNNEALIRQVDTETFRHIVHQSNETFTEKRCKTLIDFILLLHDKQEAPGNYYISLSKNSLEAMPDKKQQEIVFKRAEGCHTIDLLYEIFVHEIQAKISQGNGFTIIINVREGIHPEPCVVWLKNRLPEDSCNLIFEKEGKYFSSKTALDYTQLLRWLNRHEQPRLARLPEVMFDIVLRNNPSSELKLVPFANNSTVFVQFYPGKEYGTETSRQKVTTKYPQLLSQASYKFLKHTVRDVWGDANETLQNTWHNYSIFYALQLMKVNYLLNHDLWGTYAYIFHELQQCHAVDILCLLVIDEKDGTIPLPYTLAWLQDAIDKDLKVHILEFYQTEDNADKTKHAFPKYIPTDACMRYLFEQMVDDLNVKQYGRNRQIILQSYAQTMFLPEDLAFLHNRLNNSILLISSPNQSFDLCYGRNEKVHFEKHCNFASFHKTLPLDVVYFLHYRWYGQCISELAPSDYGHCRFLSPADVIAHIHSDKTPTIPLDRYLFYEERRWEPSDQEALTKLREYLAQDHVSEWLAKKHGCNPYYASWIIQRMNLWRREMYQKRDLIPLQHLLKVNKEDWSPSGLAWTEGSVTTSLFFQDTSQDFTVAYFKICFLMYLHFLTDTVKQNTLLDESLSEDTVTLWKKHKSFQSHYFKHHLSLQVANLQHAILTEYTTLDSWSAQDDEDYKLFQTVDKTRMELVKQYLACKNYYFQKRSPNTQQIMYIVRHCFQNRYENVPNVETTQPTGPNDPIGTAGPGLFTHVARVWSWIRQQPIQFNKNLLEADANIFNAVSVLFPDHQVSLRGHYAKSSPRTIDIQWSKKSCTFTLIQYGTVVETYNSFEALKEKVTGPMISCAPIELRPSITHMMHVYKLCRLDVRLQISFPAFYMDAAYGPYLKGFEGSNDEKHYHLARGIPDPYPLNKWYRWMLSQEEIDGSK